MNDTDPRRLLDPDAPTPSRLRALLHAALPRDPPEDIEERLEARIYETVTGEVAEAPDASTARRSAG